MPLTFKDVCDKLEKLDEVTLLEVLEISSDEIVAKFQDKIDDNFEELSEDLDDTQTDLFN
jgi:plasmid replication initiation protein|tara:strand:- start:364 stop:543 length:180 start_codon:yes stop_codon:yes gene_type:complete